MIDECNYITVINDVSSLDLHCVLYSCIRQMYHTL